MPDAISTPGPTAFLFGFERSGTTLLSMMIGAHPRIAVPLSATGLWYRYERRLAAYNRLAAAGDVERLVDDLLGEERIKMWDAVFTREEVLDGLAPGSFARVVARFHQLYAQHKGKHVWGNIDIDTLYEMDVANAWFPHTRFVHIVRDGRDVALSHQTYAFGASNLGECARLWARDLHVNLKMGAILGPDRYMVVRYEDLILDTEATLRRLCAFIGVAYAPEMLEYRRMVEEKVPESRRWLWPLLSQPLATSNVYRWRKELSLSQRIVFERAANAMLAQLGYEAYPTVPRGVQASLLELWYLLGEGHRLERLATRLGIRSRRHRSQSHTTGEGKGDRPTDAAKENGTVPPALTVR